MTIPTQSLLYAPDRANQSGVSWPAIFAGAAAAAALSMILLLLGTGLGFAASSPWPNEGVSAKALGVTTIVWLLVTQIIASGLGGYLAGRLRVKWANLHGDEVYFRDTSHGFLAWAVATLVTAALVGSVLANTAGSAAQAGAQLAGGATTAMAGAAATRGGQGRGDYYIDSLLRSADPAQADTTDAQGVASRIFGKALAGDGQLNADDRAYLAQVVAQHSNLSPEQAQQRVDQVYGQARQAVQDAKTAAQKAADTAAKVAAYTALWTFVALLCGAFFASVAALFGGRQRDRAAWIDDPLELAARERAAVR